MIVATFQFVAGSAADVLPVAIFLFLFQRLVIRAPMQNGPQIAVGFIFVVVGLGLFLVGLDQTLFPLGRLMAAQLTSDDFLHGIGGNVAAALAWHDYYWVYLFALAVGITAALAEPALIAVAMKANAVSGGAISVRGLRVAVAIGVGVGVALGCLRIIVGVPLHYFIGGAYLVVIAQTIFAPKLMVPLAFDSGGVATSTVTVPLIAALGLGLAEAVPGRSVLLDGFGLVAFACLFPIISVLAYSQLAVLRERSHGQEDAEDPKKEEDHAL